MNRPTLTLSAAVVREWSLKDFVARRPIPDDAEELLTAATIRRQAETFWTFAWHALRIKCRAVDVQPSTITDTERQAAALAIARGAAEMRIRMAAGDCQLPGINVPVPTAKQLAVDAEVEKHISDLSTAPKIGLP